MMANSRIMLTCNHCGEQFAIGNGYFGSYFTRNDKLHEQLNEFYSKHSMGNCTYEINCSDDAKDHFLILEEGDSLLDLCISKERGADNPKITCSNCKHLMFSDMYGECNIQSRIVYPSDTCEYAEPK